MTHLRKMMLEELQRRNYSQKTTKAYLHTVWEFAKYFHRSPDQLGPEHIREFQAHLFSVRKLSGNSVAQRTAALRFLFVKTLKRPDMLEHIPFPKVPLRLPTVLSPEEVTQLIDAAPNLLYRTILMTLYSTGMRLGRTRTTESCRHRQGTDAGPYSRRQGQTRPQRAAQFQTAGRPAGLLALDETDHLRLSRSGERPACGCTRLRQDRLARLPGGRPACRHHQTRSSAYPAPQLRHASSRSRRRPPHHPETARPRRIRDTTIYLHLSRKHMSSVANPLDELSVSASATVRGKVKRAKR